MTADACRNLYTKVYGRKTHQGTQQVMQPPCDFTRHELADADEDSLHLTLRKCQHTICTYEPSTPCQEPSRVSGQVNVGKRHQVISSTMLTRIELPFATGRIELRWFRRLTSATKTGRNLASRDADQLSGAEDHGRNFSPSSCLRATRKMGINVSNRLKVTCGWL